VTLPHPTLAGRDSVMESKFPTPGQARGEHVAQCQALVPVYPLTVFFYF